MKSIYLKSILVLSSLFILASCEDEPEVGDTLYPVDEVTYGCKAYINNRRIPLNASSFEVVQTPLSLVIPEDSIAFPIMLTQPMDMDVTVTVSEDKEVASAYDSEAEALDAGALNITKSTVTIPKGETVSKDSIIAKINDFEELHNFTSKAVTALKISATSEEGVSIGKNNNAYYVLFNKKVTNLKNQDRNEMSNHEAIPASEYMPSINGTDYPTLKDSDYNTYFSTTGAYDILLTMEAETSISAFSFNYGMYSGYCPTVIEIQTSSDGSTWTSQTGGEIDVLNISSKTMPCAFNFYVPIQCKYVKLRILKCYYSRYSEWYNRPAVSEVNLYK